MKISVTTDSNQIRLWLRKALVRENYAHPDRVFRDVDACLGVFKALTPQTDTYTYDDGKSKVLLCLHGTIPITYQSTLYNIPVDFWIPTEYPKVPPIAFVVPTSSMLVKPSRNVDVSGRCYHPYLHHWSTQPNDESNLITICTIFQTIFGQNPPVYTKPTTNNNNNNNSNNNNNNNNNNISNNNNNNNNNKNNNNNNNNNNGVQNPLSPPIIISRSLSPIIPPPLPPPPYQPNASSKKVINNRPRSLSGVSSSSSSNQRYNMIPSTSSVPPPTPPHPPSTQQPQQQQQQPPQQPQQPQKPQKPQKHQQQLQQLQQLQQQQQQQQQQQKQQHLQRTFSNPTTTTTTNILDDPPFLFTPLPIPSLSTIQNPEYLKLQSAVYDKVKSCCNEYLERSLPQLNKIMAIGEDLSKSQELIRQDKANLIELEKVLDNKMDFVKMKITEIDKIIEQAKNIPEVSVDDILCGTTIVYNQLFELVAEDNATEDTIYYLGKALSIERIDLNTYMKSIRTLAREQFMRRALIEKIRKQAKLDKS
ncbi:hypothetical protein Glove_306g36 [Diversispora epigaea]|uniref:UEV domain-containing protein n=1 Tax=Diversispora epigaea TaxID=1348612 RepID=A0A397HZN3_9GLOM|nr:hypothetical protein Glove_306g36 [Diversispora epigaea]